MNLQSPLLLGHRGARDYAPENTLEAFDLALAHGCDGFEFDVRATADQRMVICHDPTLAGMEIADTAFDDIVECFDREFMPKVVLAQKGRIGSEVIELEDVLDAFAGRAFLDIELKVPGLEKAVVSALRARTMRRGYVVSSFLREVLAALRGEGSDVPLGLICEKRAQLEGWSDLPIQVVIAQHRLVSRELIEAVHAAGRKLYAWTVNHEPDMRRLAEWGADALISDDTRLLASVFERSRS